MQIEDVETVLFELITQVGTARSLYIEAIRAARVGNITEAEQKLAEAGQAFTEGHRIHGDLIQWVASGEHEPIFRDDGRIMLLTHAEDQLMSAETFSILAEEFIEMHRSADKENR